MSTRRVTMADTHGGLGALTRPGVTVELSDGRSRLYARVMRVWRWRGAPRACPNGGTLRAWSVSRIVVSWTGGGSRELRALDAQPWGIVAVMVVDDEVRS